MPKVDGTDFYMFNSYEPSRLTGPGYVTLVANYMPLQDAYGGPNYFKLDPNALYEIHIDNNGDGKEDITFQFRFNNTLRGKTLAIDSAGHQGRGDPADAVRADHRRRTRPRSTSTRPSPSTSSAATVAPARAAS